MANENRIIEDNEVFISRIESLSHLGPNEFKALRISFPKMKDLNETKRTSGKTMIIKINAKYARLKYKLSSLQIQDINDMMEFKYPFLSLEEFHYALKHARWRAYDKKVDHFGYFDATYVADVINSYQEWMRTKKRP